MKPTISVIMPAFNASEHVEAAIRSCLDQALEASQVIVVDDASTDNTPDVLARIRDQRVHVERLPTNLGPSGAINAGLRCASSNWITIIGADDIWHRDRLAALMGIAESEGDLAVVLDLAAQFREEPDGHVAVRVEPIVEAYLASEEPFQQLPGSSVITGRGMPLAAPLFSRRLLELSGASYPENVRSGGDRVFLARLLSCPGATLVRSNTRHYGYRISQGSFSHSNSRWGQLLAAYDDMLDRELPAEIHDAIRSNHQNVLENARLERLLIALRKHHWGSATAQVLQSPRLLSRIPRAFRLWLRARTGRGSQGFVSIDPTHNSEFAWLYDR